MAKKKKNQSDSVSPSDETVRMDANERGRREAESQLESSQSSSDSTIIPEPPSPIQDSDIDAMIALETTTNLGAKRDELSRDDEIDKTVDAIGGDATVVIEPNDPQPSETPTVRASKTVVYQGDKDQSNAPEKPIEETTVGDLGTANDATIAMGVSALASEAIAATVNPRELSAADAKLWNAAVGNAASAERSVDQPAINRTFSDRHFDRLRRSEIAEPHSDPNLPSDYRLNRKLGQGGMGDVYLARQRSLDRLLALKVIKPLDEKRRQQLSQTGRLEKVEEERRLQFLAEAIITGDLDHPNIVPIHDVAVTTDGDLFYSMKRVDGTPWSAMLRQNSLHENLEILLRVCDAVGFAHTRNVVHRDIKPENIMLGDFGVVMVMDWGLALPTRDYDKDKQASILVTSGLGGTPAFMAPEMATGPLEKIGTTADIYLLGATLFMIITGQAPHQARNVSECLKVVRDNKIREVDEKHHGELLDIAMKTMSTLPEDRFQTVAAFQNAIREFISHDQSIGQTERAFALLERGRSSNSLAEFHRASQGFEEALKSWTGNERAKVGLSETILAHAEKAYEIGEFEAGISVLDEHEPTHSALLGKLVNARDERESRVGRLRLLRRLTAALLLFILVGGGISLLLIKNQSDKARSSAKLAIEQRGIAEIKTTEALAKTIEAERQRQIAEIERENAKLAEQQERVAKVQAVKAQEQESAAKEKAIEAEKEAKRNEKLAMAARKIAEDAKKEEAIARAAAERDRGRARYEEYVSKIGLAKVSLETNDAKGARVILEQLKDSPRSNGWEWRWLWQQANQSRSEAQLTSPVIDMSMSADGRSGAIVTDDGDIRSLDFDDDGMITGREAIDISRLGSRKATSIEVFGDGKAMAVGTQSGDIVILGDDKDQVFTGHDQQVTDLRVTSRGWLVSGSSDRTVRVWDLAGGKQLTEGKACWHLSPVQQIAISGSDESVVIAVANSDESGGRVSIWKLSDGKTFDAKPRGAFNQHQVPVTAIALSADAQYAASGDTDGNVWIWKPGSLDHVDYASAVDEALSKIQESSDEVVDQHNLRSTIRYVPLVDPSLGSESLDVSKLVSKVAATESSTKGQTSSRAHGDVVRSIHFNENGRELVTGSDDYLIKHWRVDRRELLAAMRGHGGWVVAADFLAGKAGSIVSGSNDGSVRTWNPASYRGSSVSEFATDAHYKEITSASFSPDGRHIVTASRDHTARILSIDPMTLAFATVSQLDDPAAKLDEGSAYSAMSLVVDSSGKSLYIGSADATIGIWNTRLGVEVGRLHGTGLNQTFAISGDGTLVLSGSSSPEVKAILWRVDPSGVTSPRVLHRLTGHDQTVTALAVSPDGRQLFTGDRNGFGILWDAKTGKRIGDPLEDSRGFRINEAKFSSDGSHLFISADDDQLTQLELASRRRINRFDHDGFVTDFAISSDERYAVGLSERSTETRFTTSAVFWDLNSGNRILLDEVSESIDPDAIEGSRTRRRITSVNIDPKSTVIVVGQSSGIGRRSTMKVIAFDDAIGKLKIASAAKSSAQQTDRVRSRSLEVPERLGGSEALLLVSGQELVTMNQNAAFRWNLTTGDLIKSYRSHVELTEASFSADGRLIATASRSVKIWDAASGKAIGKLEAPHIGPVRTVAFAPVPVNGNDYVFATGGDDGVARLWQWKPATQEVTSLKIFKPDVGREIRRLRFSMDAKNLLIVGQGGSVDVWPIAQDEPQWTYRSETVGDFVCASFSSDGRFIAVGSTDHRIRVWQLDQGRRVLGEPVVMEGHADTVRDVVLMGSGEDLRVFSASADDSARVWDPRFGMMKKDGQQESGREIVSLRRHSGDVTAVDIADDGRLLMSAGNDGQVILWPAAPSHDTDPPVQDDGNNLFDALDQP